MTRSILTYCAATLISAAVLFGGCNDTVTAQDCHVKCQDADNVCVQKCTDDSCRTACTTDLDNCSASCASVTVSPPKSDGG